jgi:hypothetical protein
VRDRNGRRDPENDVRSRLFGATCDLRTDPRTCFNRSSLAKFRAPASVVGLGDSRFAQSLEGHHVRRAVAAASDWTELLFVLGREYICHSIASHVTRDGILCRCASLEVAEFHPATRLEAIPGSCFCHSGLVEVQIPSSVKHMEEEAFASYQPSRALRLLMSRKSTTSRRAYA